ncbi:MAG: helix-turn-helix domain-containing protein [Gemmatimonadaceae bacterium]
MSLIAALFSDQTLLTPLRAAVRDRFEVVVCADWAELVRSCGEAPVSIAVLDPGMDTTTTYESLRQLKLRFPHVALVLYVASPPARLRDVFHMGRSGADQVIVAEEDDDPRTLLALLEGTQADGVGEFVRRAIGEVKPTARDATLLAVTRVHEPLSPESLARLLGVQRKTLTRRLAAAGFPNPQRLIAWGRLIVAGRMLEDRQRSADGVAVALGFPSGSAFRNTCQRYLHATPQQIRARGGARYVVGVFLRERREDTTREREDARARECENATT